MTKRPFAYREWEEYIADDEPKIRKKKAPVKKPVDPTRARLQNALDVLDTDDRTALCLVVDVAVELQNRIGLSADVSPKAVAELRRRVPQADKVRGLTDLISWMERRKDKPSWEEVKYRACAIADRIRRELIPGFPPHDAKVLRQVMEHVQGMIEEEGLDYGRHGRAQVLGYVNDYIREVIAKLEPGRRGAPLWNAVQVTYAPDAVPAANNFTYNSAGRHYRTIYIGDRVIDLLAAFEVRPNDVEITAVGWYWESIRPPGTTRGPFTTEPLARADAIAWYTQSGVL